MNFNHPTLITVTAPTCSGKTYLLEGLSKLGFKRIVGFTTRGPRPGEAEGKDYYFKTLEEAEQLERDKLLAESALFRGNKYGVTHAEMDGKMGGEFPPIVILEPTGLVSYEKYCQEKGWNIFKVFVSVPEALRIKRLNERTAQDVMNAILEGRDGDVIKIISTHSDRLMSITGDERLWQSLHRWDAIVPGDDFVTAVDFIKQGIQCRNTRNAEINK